MVSADRVFKSSSLDVCQSNSSFTASLFTIVFTPNNRRLALNVVGESTTTGNVTFKVQATAYGYTFLTESLDPCTLGLSSMCPMSKIQTGFDTTFSNISLSIIDKIPSIAYTIPDLDATVTVYMFAASNPTVSLACVRSQISNGQTVDQEGIRWATAIVAGLGLAAWALVSGLGHINTAAHLALYASSLFHYFQAVAIIGLCAVPLPPIVQSWTQNFSWSIGIIKVTFLQKMATWYQITTGGTPTTILTTLSTKSVQVVKRNVDSSGRLAEEVHSLYQRAQTATIPSGGYIVSGMKRVAFRADMESTNLFLTVLTIYCIFVVFTMLGVTLLKELCELAIRAKWVKSQSQSHRLQNFRDDWLVTLKGIIFRPILIGYPPMMILCFWEFTQNDSPAELVLAVIFFFGMSAALALATFKVIQIAKRSGQIHKTPAYLLYADATVLNKLGFLYIQFRASAYYYVFPTLAYVLVKATFIGLGQKSGTTQAIALVVIEAATLIGASVIHPWMDKPTNAVNIAICVINFLNATLLFIFTNVFDGPGLLIGVVGVVFFVVNVVFALVLLFIVLFAVAFSFIRKNPETRYQPIADNRASFVKSQTMLATELDMLGSTARGGVLNEYKDGVGLDNSGKDLQSSDLIHHQHDTVYSNAYYGEPFSTLITPIAQYPAFIPTNYQSSDDLASSHERSIESVPRRSNFGQHCG
jgi:hypothetical protein